MIGVFDSGYGGLAILRALVDTLPNESFVYLGDNARAPYGSRTSDEIFSFTLQCVERLFAEGCDLVILACNTASANALRRIQQEILPTRHPNKRVLGILVPTVEQVRGNRIAIFATPATVQSGAYTHEIKKRHPHADIVEIACPGLVPLIEGDANRDALVGEIQTAVAALPWRPDAVLLGCTHYGLVLDLFREALPGELFLFDQPALVADRLRDYLVRHPSFAHAGRPRTLRFLTTADPDRVTRLGSRFFGDPIAFEGTDLSG